jgi:endonuclease G
MTFLKTDRRGKVTQNKLIGLILLLTFVGIGIHYYLQYRHKTPIKPIITAPKECPIEPAVAEATRNTGNIVYGGLPGPGKNSVAVLKNIAFYVGYCEERKSPLWVAFRIDGKKQRFNLKRPSRFTVDTRTRSRVDPGWFKGSGYDRGHMAPNSSISSQYGRDAQLETFMMSNITPQTPDLNRKIWANLEKQVIEYAHRYETVWVFTGPIFDEHLEFVTQHVQIPDAFFKILVDEKEGNIRTMAFIVPQTVTGRERLEQFLTSVDEIEKLTGLDFFAPMSDELEDKLEVAVENSLWY